MARRFAAVVAWLVQRWLLVVALGLTLYLGMAFAAPWLAMAGYHGPSDVLYAAYRLGCHQLPQRSWFISGQAATYDWATVRDFYAFGSDNWWLAYHRPIRDPVLGYQVALCERDVAMFGGLLAVTLLLAAWRGRRPRPLPFLLVLAAGLPAAVDGMTQLVGWRESTPILRTWTGALFGAAIGLFVLPMVDDGVQSVGPPRQPAIGTDGRPKATSAAAWAAPASDDRPASVGGPPDARQRP